MSNHQESPREHAFEALGRLAREQNGQTLDARAHAAGRNRLVAAVAAQGGRTAPRRLPVRWLALAAAACALAAVVTWMAWPASALRYTLHGTTEAEGGYVRALEPAAIDFSDGSRVALDAGAAVRVLGLDAHGARLSVEGGRIELQVVHADDTRWSVQAGPYAVAVTGTRFSVDWKSGPQSLYVAVDEGAVVVRGPLAEEGVTLHARQALHATPTSGELRLETLDESARTALGGPIPSAANSAAASTVAQNGPSDPSPSASAAPNTSASGVGSSTATVAGTSASSAARPPSWSALVARGEFDAVLAEANAVGVDSALGSRPLDDVLALADAARYRGQGAIALRALARIRERFPGSEAAASAAFLLGRMDEGASVASAIGWYDRYLAEAPRGAFAAEALGRKMAAVHRSAGRDAARPLAKQYLRLYPRGAHAGLAHQIDSP